ncbi:class I glutamine amidotransferase-like protein [Cyathus striatus]|nr:class I glutamine amidotransferase-like protein [Cyathus striatus]
MSSVPANSTPVNYGVLLFPAFQALDVFGPLDALNMLSMRYSMNLYIIAATLDPVSTRPVSAVTNPMNSNFSESIVPTHTFSDPPPLDVLIVPGGLGTRVPDFDNVIEFVRTTYPKLQHLITVCTGAGIAARAGVLDGKRATTNKQNWAQTIALGPNVDWVARARWVQDGNTWTSSGVSAGIDVIFAFIASVHGETVATDIANVMEYERHLDPNWDPFADMYGLKW